MEVHVQLKAKMVICIDNMSCFVDHDQSYYVGDAAGRHDGWKVGAVKDFNNTDRKFAASLEIAFHTPEHFFLSQICPEDKWSYGKFDPKTWPKHSKSQTPTHYASVVYGQHLEENFRHLG